MEGNVVSGKRYNRISEDAGDASNNDHHFESFVEATTLKEAYASFIQLHEYTDLEPFEDYSQFIKELKSHPTSWRARELLKEIDNRANRKEYNKRNSCANTKVFIVGAGPCGLRASIELALLGAKVVLVEKRDKFTRNNVLYLWPYLINDLINLGAKKLYGKLGSGSINHISIIKLQMILLKIALLVGVEIHYNVEFQKLDENPKKNGWRAILKQKDHKVSKFEFDVIICADGRQNTLPDFTWKVNSRALAIGITANFVNRQSENDALTEEIPGKSYIYDQEFFRDLKKTKQIDLENVVYYKDETHYFVMTAKKQSLLDKGVIKKDFADTSLLLAPTNVNQKKLEKYAREAAVHSTNEKLPTQEFAKNHNNLPDIAMFDFTSRSQATKAALKKEVNGKELLMAVIGDSLKEPFWPEGTGCALGFLGLFDTVWMIRSWATGDRTLDEALQDREVIYKLLSNTKQEDLNKHYNGYSIDPRTRYTSQVALDKKLYKQEHKRTYNIQTTPSPVPERVSTPTKIREIVDKTDPKSEMKTTSRNRFRFSFRRKKRSKEDVDKQREEKAKQREEKAKSDKREKRMKKEAKSKEKNGKKKSRKSKKEKKREELDVIQRNENNSKNVESRFERLRNHDGEKWTMENKSKSLDRLKRDTNFSDAFKKFQGEPSNESETNSNKTMHNGGTADKSMAADETKSHKRGWSFRRKKHKKEKKDNPENTEAKKKQEKSNLRNYNMMQDDDSFVSSSSAGIKDTRIENVSNTESTRYQNDADETSCTDPEYVHRRKNRTEHSGGLLTKFGFGRGSKLFRGRKDYNNLHMEVER